MEINKNRKIVGDDKMNQSENIFKKLFTEKSSFSPEDHLLDEEIIKTVNEIKIHTKQVVSKWDPAFYLEQRPFDYNNNRLIKTKEKVNIKREEQESIAKLKSNPDIVIKSADKGSATVIMNKTQYIGEAERQLNNSKYYIKLEEPIHQKSVTEIHSILGEMCFKKFITKDQLKYFKGPTEYRPRTFYLLPKIHKKVDSWPHPGMPEGRPIVSDVDSETYRISQLIDHFLNPLATDHPSYIKNSFEFCNKIRNKQINQNYLLVTGDITSLYTNMNIERMLKCVKEAFQKTKIEYRSDEDILKLLEISLKNNDFIFNDQYYLQILGCAMGKRFAPALANLYLLEFDNMATTNFPIRPLYFMRYLDDIFFVWPGDLNSLKQFENYLNTLIPDIKINFEHSPDEISFLDTTVYKTNGILNTRTYFKPTDTHQLLHTDSFHPKHTFSGLLKSQFIRFKRLSSTREDYDNTCKILIKYLCKRGYTQGTMRRLQHEIWFGHKKYSNNGKKIIPKLPTNTESEDSNNENRIENNKNQVSANRQGTDQNKKEILPIITDYCRIGTELANGYKKALNSNAFFNQYKIVTAYTNSKNLKQMLVRSQLEGPELKGAFRGCDDVRCVTCKIHSTGTTRFKNEQNGKEYTLTDTIYCKSMNLVYLITCQKCKHQYVGETGRTLRDRLNDHRSAIKNKSSTPIGIHFNKEGHSVRDLSITPIELIKDTTNSTKTRRDREQHWKTKLNTLFPRGINNTPSNK